MGRLSRMVSSSVSHRHQVVKVSSAHSEGIPAGVLVAKGSVEAARLDSLPVNKVSAAETTGGDGLPVHLHHLPNTGPKDLLAHYQGRVRQAHITLVPLEFLREPGLRIEEGWRRGTPCWRCWRCWRRTWPGPSLYPLS